jgi:hypothetical protein
MAVSQALRLGNPLGSNYPAVIVAVVAVWVVQVPVYQIVDMVPVGNCRVAATFPMYVARFMTRASMSWCAGIRVRIADF